MQLFVMMYYQSVKTYVCWELAIFILLDVRRFVSSNLCPLASAQPVFNGWPELNALCVRCPASDNGS
jgi:hypothetical protein